jgi:hypothetical protein
VGPFADRAVGQMNKYVNYYRERVPAYPWERPAIGLIIHRLARQRAPVLGDDDPLLQPLDS